MIDFIILLSAVRRMEKSIYSDEYTKFLDHLKQTRKNVPITQEQLAKSLGQTQSFISKVERGERRLDLVELRAFCNALGVEFPSFVSQLDKILSEGGKLNERK
jgi:transcriptional regulator with XRE-family HTH domain